MKHFLSYAADGRLVGIHTHHHAGTKLGGWPSDINLDDPTCQNSTSKWFRENVIGKNGAIGFIACECDCSPTETTCSCASEDFASKKVENGLLVSKLEGALLAGQTVVQSGSRLKRSPGSKFNLKVVCARIADGSKIEVAQRGGVVILEESPIQLTFAGGETAEFEVTAPSQGLTGTVFVLSKDILPISVNVLGWA